MDGYDRLRAVTMALRPDQLRDCVESLVLGLYGLEQPDGSMVLSTDRDWSDDIVDGVIQVLADYGLHPDDFNDVLPSRTTRSKGRGRVATGHLRLVPRREGTQVNGV